MFRYYVTDINDGTVKGTDDEETAISYSFSEEHFVVDTKTGKWLIEGLSEDIEEVK